MGKRLGTATSNEEGATVANLRAKGGAGKTALECSIATGKCTTNTVSLRLKPSGLDSRFGDKVLEIGLLIVRCLFLYSVVLRGSSSPADGGTGS